MQHPHTFDSASACPYRNVCMCVIHDKVACTCMTHCRSHAAASQLVSLASTPHYLPAASRSSQQVARLPQRCLLVRCTCTVAGGASSQREVPAVSVRCQQLA
eukprot:1161027-Pelagomonas_calceolata.AAC.6